MTIPFRHIAITICLVTMIISNSWAQEGQAIEEDSVIVSQQRESSPITQAEIDSLPIVDNKKQKKEKFKLIKSIMDKKKPNPNRAAALSLLLPGAGQIYNKKYWKLPFVYGAIGGLGYYAYFNNNLYKDFREAYRFEVDEDMDTVNPFTTLDAEGLRTLRDRYNKRRQEGYVFVVLAWTLNSVDAFVDAHLASFDVNEDISMHVNPTGITLGQATAYGVSVKFTNRDKSPSKLVSPF